MQLWLSELLGILAPPATPIHWSTYSGLTTRVVHLYVYIPSIESHVEQLDLLMEKAIEKDGHQLRRFKLKSWLMLQRRWTEVNKIRYHPIAIGVQRAQKGHLLLIQCRKKQMFREKTSDHSHCTNCIRIEVSVICRIRNSICFLIQADLYTQKAPIKLRYVYSW